MFHLQRLHIVMNGVPHNDSLLAAESLHKRLRVFNRELHIFETFFIDSVDECSVVRHRPFWFDKTIEENFVRDGIDNRDTAESIGLFLLCNRILCLTHFTINCNNLRIVLAPITKAFCLDPSCFPCCFHAPFVVKINGEAFVFVCCLNNGEPLFAKVVRLWYRWGFQRVVINFFDLGVLGVIRRRGKVEISNGEVERSKVDSNVAG
mmetsp:Transcript_4246/g.8899  ORF Transcript_4246/g.8899 Transcript_4246/m.8899 type:complete len:206 (+) Transcript_4246:665-1282(+)